MVSAVIAPVGGALMPAGADQAFNIGFHQDLQHRLRNGSQKIAITALLQQVNERHSVVGHRVLGGLWVKCLHLHLSRTFPVTTRRSRARRAPCYRALRPARAHPRISTTSADANRCSLGCQGAVRPLADADLSGGTAP